MNKLLSLLVLSTIIFGVTNNNCYSAKRYSSVNSKTNNSIDQVISLFDELRNIGKTPKVRNLTPDIVMAINNIVAKGDICRRNVLQLRRIINERNILQRRRNILQRRETINNDDTTHYIRLYRSITLLSSINSILTNINAILIANNHNAEELIRAELSRLSHNHVPRNIVY